MKLEDIEAAILRALRASTDANVQRELRVAQFGLQSYMALKGASPVEQHAAASCKHCGATTSQACNDKGCFYLESGDGEPAPADERAAFPRYAEWLHLRTHGEWSNGVPEWARDHTGRMNDFAAATAVIEELAAARAASANETGTKPRTREYGARVEVIGTVVTLFVNGVRITSWGQDRQRHVEDIALRINGGTPRGYVRGHDGADA